MHNKKNYLLLATMILMVLVGCQTANNEATNLQDTTVTSAVESTVTPEMTATPSEEITPTVTPVATIAPTEMPEVTPTAEPTVAPTSTPVPTATPTVAPTATPVPTATSTPTPTPTSKFTFKDMDKELYAKSSVNVRSLPSTEGDKLGSLSAWEKIKVTGQCNETSWYRIEYNNGIGYVSNNYLVANKPTPTPTATPVPTATPIPEYVYTELDCVMYSTMVGTIYKVPSGYPIRGGNEKTFTAGTEFKVTGWCDETSCYRVEYEDGVGYIDEYYLTDSKSDPNVVVNPNDNAYSNNPCFKSIEVKFGGYKIKFPVRDNTLYFASSLNSESARLYEYKPDKFLEPGYKSFNAKVFYDLEDRFVPEELTMDWARERFLSPELGRESEDFIIETEVDGRPCYIRVGESADSSGGWTTEYWIDQEIGDGVVLFIQLRIYCQPERLNYYVEKLSGNGKYWYKEITCNKEAHLARVLPYLITQDQIQ